MHPLHVDEQEAVIRVYEDVTIGFICHRDKGVTWENVLFHSCFREYSRVQDGPISIRKEAWIAAKKMAMSAIKKSRERAERKKEKETEAARQYKLL